MRTPLDPNICGRSGWRQNEHSVDIMRILDSDLFNIASPLNP